MMNYLRFRYRRWLRRVRREARAWRKLVGEYVDRHIWGKWHQVGVVRRFLLLWMTVMVVSVVGVSNQLGALTRASQMPVPQPGGIYSEAAVGTVQVLNPLLPESAATSDINRLIFSGLTRYNGQGRLVADLATRWEVSTDGREYTFYLREGVKWHDGVPFTADDVEFTITAIQTPDSRSPLASSWQGVRVETQGKHKVVFHLPSPLASFLDSTTLGIVPRHMLETVEPSSLREADFNQEPVGTGPFKLKTFAPAAREIALEAYGEYYGGQPQLEQFVFRFYDSPEEALEAFARRQVTSPGRIMAGQELLPSKFRNLSTFDMSLPEEITAFYNLNDQLLRDKALRGILTRIVDRDKVVAAAGGDGLAVSQPLLPGQPGYTVEYAPQALTLDAARAALDQAGWKAGAGKVRQKDSRKLELRIVTLAGSELEKAAGELANQWRELGADTDVRTVELEELQQTHMRPRNFQILLFGMNIGADPDVYPFWHSSQAKDPGVNLSGYANDEADRSLESGRIKSDEAVRVGKYQAFLKSWNEDFPAVVLYQTSFRYGAQSEAAGMNARRLMTPGDRFYNVHMWTVRQRYAPILP